MDALRDRYATRVVSGAPLLNGHVRRQQSLAKRCSRRGGGVSAWYELQTSIGVVFMRQSSCPVGENCRYLARIL